MSHERIWICRDNPVHDAHWSPTPNSSDDVEYVRADILEAAQAEARELKTKLFHAERQRDVASRGLQAEARQSDEQRERACAAEREARELRQIDDQRHATVLGLSDELVKTRAELARVREAGEIMARKLDELGVPVPDLDLARRGILSQPDERPASPDSALPLMARREWMPARHTVVFVEGKEIITTSDDETRDPGGDFTTYRIADTDEHGLKVIPRTPDMPAIAKVRSRPVGVTEDEWSYEAPMWIKYAAKPGWETQRIEDFQHGQEGQVDG